MLEFKVEKQKLTRLDVVECEYIKDTNKVIQKIADALNITI